MTRADLAVKFEIIAHALLRRDVEIAEIISRCKGESSSLQVYNVCCFNKDVYFLILLNSLFCYLKLYIE